ncbi:hypothetical protein ABFT51_24145 [Paenibacillus peoriae]|uniref:hypothetical protein n=1 Tax=Paenibacillus peoriae TaxID=59893 RepID=UPI0032AFDA87
MTQLEFNFYSAEVVQETTDLRKGMDGKDQAGTLDRIDRPQGQRGQAQGIRRREQPSIRGRDTYARSTKPIDLVRGQEQVCTTHH